MDSKKTGLFIAGLRREKELTQKELAEQVGVTDKAVSRWETGKGFPDISQLPVLAGALDVSITEIVNGERSRPEQAEAQADSAVLETLAYAGKMRQMVTGALLLLFGIGFLLSPLYISSRRIIWEFPVLGVLLAGAGILLLCRRNRIWGRKRLGLLSPIAAQLAALCSLAAALVLEILPYGAVLVFAVGPENRQRQTFSCFSLIPLGYANGFPLLTALLTVASAGLLLFLLFRRKRSGRLQNAAFLCTVIACVTSILPLPFFGVAYMSAAGLGITFFLLFSGIAQAFSNRRGVQE